MYVIPVHSHAGESSDNFQSFSVADLRCFFFGYSLELLETSVTASSIQAIWKNRTRQRIAGCIKSLAQVFIRVSIPRLKAGLPYLPFNYSKFVHYNCSAGLLRISFT